MKRYLQAIFLSACFSATVQAQTDWDFAINETPAVSMYGENVTHDIYGNIYVIGSVDGTTNFGGIFNRPGQGGLDIFVAKYDYLGSIQWVTTMGSLEDELGYAIKYDNLSDQVIIGGYVGASGLNLHSGSGLAIGAIPVLAAGFEDIFVGLLDANSGELNGHQVLGGDGSDALYDLAFDASSGKIFITGEFQGNDIVPADFGTTSGAVDIELMSTFNGTFYSQDAFLAALAPDLSTLWAYNIGGAGDDAGRGMTFRDDYGEIVVAGEFYSELVFNHNSGASSPVNSVGGADVFVGHYDTSGNLTAQTTIGGIDNAFAIGVAMGRNGEVYVTGRFDGAADFGASNVISDGDFDVFLAREVDGIWEWAVKAGSLAFDQADAVAVTSDDQPVITGWINGNAIFGSGVTGQVNVTNVGSQTLFLAEYNQNTGQLNNVLSASGTGGDLSFGVTIYGDYAYIVGQSNSLDADFGGTILNSGGVNSMFLASANGYGPFQEVSIPAFAGYTNGAYAWGDYDSDGDMDVTMQGWRDPTDFATSQFSRLYESNGTDFTEFDGGTVYWPWQGFGDLDWGDYDRDGDVDLVISGWEGSNGVNFKRIIRNDGGSNFVDIDTGLPDFDGSSDWGDYDQDGDLDLLITAFDVTWQTFIYRNDGGDVFTDIGAGLNPSKNAEFIDYDNDGDLDVFLDGDDDGGLFGTALYENVSGVFTINTSIPNAIVAFDAYDWGDYDNDGDQDLAFTGQQSGSHPFFLFRNDGGGTFTQVSTIIPGFERGDMDWGDFDNDGDLDLLATGSGVDLGGTAAFIVENKGFDEFEVIDMGFEPLSDASVGWIDYDSDGYLDALLFGTNSLNESQTTMYRNFGAFVSNVRPDPPSNPSSTINGSNVQLSWTWPGDDTTPPDGLVYNVKVGTTSGGVDIVSPNSLANGRRLLIDDGNAGSNSFFDLEGLPIGTYFWSVQAIDAGKRGSDFVAETTFEITGSLGSLSFWSYPHSFSQIELQWNDIASEVNYEIHRSSDGGNNFSLVATLAADEVRYRDTGLQSNTVYHYLLRAVDGVGGFTDSDTIFESTFSTIKNTRFSTGKTFGGTGFDQVRSVSSDTNGDMYFFGEFTNGIDFEGQVLATNGVNIRSGYLVKTDADLNVIWSRMIEPTIFLASWGVDVSAAGEVYVSGYFEGDINFAGDVVSSTPGIRALYVAKYDASGNEIWMRTLTSADPSFSYGVSAGEAGYVYVGGEVQGDYSFASLDIIAYGPVLLKYDADGNEIWSVSPSNDGSWLGWAYNVEADGLNVYLSGSFGAVTDFGGATLTSQGGSDVFIAKYDLSGNLIWAKGASGDGDDRTLGIALDADGNIYLGGYFTSTDFDHFGGGIQSNKSPGSGDNFLTKLDTDGNHLWTNVYGTSDWDQAFDLVSDGTNIYQTGFTSVLSDQFIGIDKTNGSYFLMSFDAVGNSQWLDIGEGNAWGRGMELANGALYVGANFTYSINTNGTPSYSDSESRDVIFGKVTNFSLDGDGPSIVFTSQPMEYEVGSGGTLIDFTVNDASSLNSVEVAFAQIGSIGNDADFAEYAFFTADFVEGDQYSIQLLDEDFDNIGAQYFVTATDEFGNVGISTPFPAYTYRMYEAAELSLSNVASQLSNDNSPDISDFDLVAVPVTDATVNSVLDINPGSETMQIFHYNNGSTSALVGSSSIVNTDGYWLIYRASAGVDLAFGGRVPHVNNLSPIVKTLNAGWNQLGNPFPFPISWEDVYNYNVGIGNIPDNGMSSNWFGWDKSGFYDGGTGQVGENQGFFIESNEPYTIAIPLPNTLATFFNTFARKGNSPLDAEEWKVRVDLHGEKLGYRVAAVGMHPEANVEFDDFDLPPLPHLDDYVTLSAKTERDNSDVSQNIIKTVDAYIWNFEAKSSLDAQKSMLTWDNSTFGENDKQLFLYDLEADRIVNMREQSEYHFNLDKSRGFQIVFGDDTFVKENLVSNEVTVGNAYPNPFNQQMTIPLSLAESKGGYFVRAEVYNSMGQQVNTLIHSPLTQGFYSIAWDGTNLAGQELADGIYYYKIVVESNNNSKEFNGKIIFKK